MIDPTKFDSEVEQHDPTKKQKTGNTDVLKKQFLTAVIVLVTNILFTATVYAQPTVWGSASPSVIEANTQLVTLSWGSSNADYCEANGGSFPTSGSIPSGPFPAGSHSQSFSCTGPGGTSNTLYASVTIQDPPPPIPTTPTGLTSSSFAPETGSSYTVSWAASSGATSYQLTQNGTPQSLSVTSQTFNPGSAGTYNYTVSACNASGCSAASTAIGVVVTDPLPTPVAITGFDANYEAFWSSSPSDNSLYFLRDNSDGNYEGVTGFILEEQLDGSYSLNANPTSAQISQFNLSAPAAIAYELADMNLDGAVDMVLFDSSNIATGFVYAATSSQSAPIAYKHIDSEFVEFFEDLILGIEDPSYYDTTARLNNWGTWEYGDVRIGWHYTDELFLSGQLFRGVEPFYTDVYQAFDPARPDWCNNPYPQSDGYYNPVYGVWEVWGIYQDLVEFHEDFSLSDFNQDALQVAEPLMHYLSNESSGGIPAMVFAILEDILGVTHELDAEPAIYNLAKLMEQMLFGLGADQQTKAPDNYAKIELIYTNPTSSMGMPVPLARHAYLQVTMPSGSTHVTRGGPEDPPSYGSFGDVETEYALDPQDDNDFDDYGKSIKFRQLVGFTNLNSVTVGSILGLFSSSINSCSIEYKPFSQNSNSYAFQAAEAITATLRPVAQVWAPGYETFLICP